MKRVKKYDTDKILKEIYRMRGLTIDQLCEVVFDTRHYAYKFLKEMQSDGYLGEKMNMSNRRRLGKLYYCTDKGIERLYKNGLIEKQLKSKDNKPHNASLKYVINTNNVYAALTPYGIHMYDSREWKKKYGMDRNSMVRGGLKLRDGREIAIYCFFSPDQISKAGLSNAMLQSFRREIKKFPQSSRIAVICYDSDIYKRVLQAVDKDKELGSFEELLVIPYGTEDFGLNVLRISRDQKERQTLIESHLNARLFIEHPALTGNRQDFVNYVGKFPDGREEYIIDYLSFNRVVLQHLDTHYHEQAYNKDQRQVSILCWLPNVKELKTRYQAYKHVKIVGISIQNIKEEYLPNLPKVKMQIPNPINNET